MDEMNDVYSIYGGNIEDCKPPFKREFDDKRKKRKITFTVTQYISRVNHYYVSAKEEFNPIWDKKENAWRECWDDEDGKGFYENEKFDTAKYAEDWIEMMKKKYPNHKYEIDEYCESKTIYGYEGD